MSVKKINSDLQDWVKEDNAKRCVFFVSMDKNNMSCLIDGNRLDISTALTEFFNNKEEAAEIARIALRVHDRMKAECHEQEAL